MNFSNPTLLTKRQRFDDSENEEKKATQRQRDDRSENQEINPDYILLLMLSHQKVTNRLLNLEEGTKSLTHFISI